MLKLTWGKTIRFFVNQGQTVPDGKNQPFDSRVRGCFFVELHYGCGLFVRRMSVRRSLAAPNDIVSQYISSRPHFVEDHVIEGRIQSFVCVYVDYVIHSVQPRDEFRGILKVRVYPVGPGYLSVRRQSLQCPVRRSLSVLCTGIGWRIR